MASMEEKRPRTVVVAGGAGFVGSHLCDHLLAQGDRVICVDNFLTGAAANVEPLDNHPRFTLIRQDIVEPLRIDGPVDAIYNLACAASPPLYQADPVHTMMTCVLGTRNLLDLAEAKGARFLLASTSEVYGDPEQHPQIEDYRGNVSCTGPRACYDEGKRAAETLCFDMLRHGRVDARVARIFNTYGPRMREDDGRIVSNLICQALRGEDLTIYGTGQQTRSFCYVADLVLGLMALMGADPNPGVPVNLGNPTEITILTLMEMVVQETGSAARLVYRPLPQDDPQRRRPDVSRAAALLGWQPEVPLRDGLAATITYFRSQMGGAPVPQHAPARRVQSAH